MNVCDDHGVPKNHFLVECAVSGGTMEDYLRRCMALSHGKLCVRLLPVYRRIPLPCPDGVGQPLTAEELQVLHGEEPCFFSKALCTEYFVRRESDGYSVILFDTLRSLREKLQAIRAAEVPWVSIPDPQLRQQHNLREKAPHGCGVP